jgi:uncharacterized membrane protein
MKNKHVGLILMIVALIVGIIVYLFNRALTQIVNTSCDHGPSCPMWGSIKFHTNLSLILFLIILALGIFLFFFKEKNDKKENIKRKIDTSKLIDEEKKIINLLSDNEGSLFQSDIVEKTDFTKVKVTRILDKLEGKQLIERKRRGMTNVVLLK